MEQIYNAIASSMDDLDIDQGRKLEFTSFVNESLSKLKKRSHKRTARKRRLRRAYDMLQKAIIDSGATHSLHWDESKLSNQQPSPDISHVQGVDGTRTPITKTGTWLGMDTLHMNSIA